MLNLSWLISHSEPTKKLSSASDDSASTRAKVTARKSNDEATKNLIRFNDTKSLRSVAARRAYAVRCGVARNTRCGRISPA